MEKSLQNLPVIQSLWIGEKLSTMEKLSINSFLKNGHPFHLYVYNDIRNIPAGTIVKDANEIINREKIFKYKDRDSYAGFANLFRYKLLLEKGGFWVDLDVIYIKPFNFSKEYIFSGTKEWKKINLFNMSSHIQNCVIGAPVGSEIMQYCYEVANNKNSANIKWGETGPDLVETAVIKFGLEHNVLYGAFSPFVWQSWRKLISNSILDLWEIKIRVGLCRSYAVHLYNEMWRLEGIDKNARFPQICIYERLKNRYGITSLILSALTVHGVQDYLYNPVCII